LSEFGIQPPFCNYFHATPKKIFKVQYKAGRKPRASDWPYINKQIKIAIWFRLTTCHRTKYSDIGYTVFCGDAFDVFSFLAKYFFSNHRFTSAFLVSLNAVRLINV
jgi:hypothetical protein